MEDQRSNRSERERSGIEMTTFLPPEQPTPQVCPFPGSAQRQSTDNQRTDRELDGHPVVESIPPTQDDAVHDNVITSGISRSSAASTSGQSSEQELPRLFSRDNFDILNAEPRVIAGYVKEMREIISLNERREEMPIRGGLDTEIGSRGYASDDENYFLAESEFQFYPFSAHGGMRHLDGSEPTREFVYSSIRKSKRGTKQQHRASREGSREVDDENRMSYQKNDDNTSEQLPLEQEAPEPKSQDFPSRPTRHPINPTQSFLYASIRKPGAKRRLASPVESTEADGVFWKREDIASEQSSLEKGVPEPKRQWYRSKKTRPEDLSSPRCYSAIFAVILAIIIFIIVAGLFYFLYWIQNLKPT